MCKGRNPCIECDNRRLKENPTLLKKNTKGRSRTLPREQGNFEVSGKAMRQVNPNFFVLIIVWNDALYLIGKAAAGMFEKANKLFSKAS